MIRSLPHLLSQLLTGRTSRFVVLSALSLAPSVQAGAGFSLVPAPDSFEAIEGPAVRDFLAHAERQLPDKLKTRIGRPVRVRFKKLSSTVDFAAACSESSTPEQLGYVMRSFLLVGGYQEIVLNQAFLPEIRKGERGSSPVPCRQGTAYRMALATLLHELSHIYDFEDPKTPADLAEIERCALGESRSRECERLNRIQGFVSDHRPFSALADSYLNSRRSPDSYEKENLQENFAVNMEFFLLDPRFACRRPALHRFLAEHFGLDPFPERDCRTNTTIHLYSSGKSVSLDTDRVYQLHFLLAARGQAAMSRWGHAMFRIIVCAPERAVPGPECLKDVEHHLVVGFRAANSEARYDPLKGIIGGYSSRILAYSLAEIRREYADEELRDLLSLPLTLTREQMASFLEHALELYWGFNDPYRFFTRNCATNALLLLQSALHGEHPLQQEEVTTPLGLYETLLRVGPVDASVLQTLERARIEGYLFESKKEKLKSAFRFLKAFPEFAWASLKSILEESAPSDRLLSFERLRASHPESTKKLAAAFLILESRIVYLEQEAARAKIATVMEKPRYEAEVRRFQLESARLDPAYLTLNPASRASYGVPLDSETLSASEIAEKWKSAQTLSIALMDRIVEDHPEFLLRQEKSRANIEAYRRALLRSP
ncbi:MAG: DUF4105 domain-containing protein [Oligoflexia bacterium]|nr:DUF4105 domain-containing protein [Oligoflexia bacterium]